MGASPHSPPQGCAAQSDQAPPRRVVRRAILARGVKAARGGTPGRRACAAGRSPGRRRLRRETAAPPRMCGTGTGWPDRIPVPFSVRSSYKESLRVPLLGGRVAGRPCERSGHDVLVSDRPSTRLQRGCGPQVRRRGMRKVASGGGSTSPRNHRRTPFETRSRRPMTTTSTASRRGGPSFDVGGSRLHPGVEPFGLPVPCR